MLDDDITKLVGTVYFYAVVLVMKTKIKATTVVGNFPTFDILNELISH